VKIQTAPPKRVHSEEPGREQKKGTRSVNNK